MKKGGGGRGVGVMRGKGRGREGEGKVGMMCGVVACEGRLDS